MINLKECFNWWLFWRTKTRQNRILVS